MKKLCYNVNMKKILLTLGILLSVSGSAFAYTMPRWGMTAIDVYLPESQYEGTIKSAFETWASSTNGRVKFRYNSTRFFSNNAPIKVNIIEERTKYFISEAKRFETTGYFTNMDEGYINRANLTVYTIDRNGKNVKDEELYASLLLEIGYILGLDKVYGPCEGESVMCYEKYGKVSSLSSKDRQQMVEKYTRTNNEIKKNNPNTSK